MAAELSRRGNIASITLRNTKGVDILVANEAGTKTALVQVKTNKGANRSWILNSKAERISEDQLFYVFVALGGEDGVPAYHVVPSKVVAQYTTRSHRNWLAGTKSGGSARKDSGMRKFNDPDGEYLDAWHLLRLG